MRRVLLVMMVTIGAIVPGGRAAVAEPDGPSITVIGKRTAYVDVHFDEKFQLEGWTSEIDFKGQFAGWLLHPLDRTPEYNKGDFVGAYMIRKVAPTDPDYDPHLSSITHRTQTFSPGRYRVYLVTDGPAKITIPFAKGTRSKTIRPVHPTTASATAEDIPVTPPGIVNGNVSQPIRVRPDSLSISSIYLYSEEGATVQNVAACMRNTSEVEEPPAQNCEGGGVPGAVLHAQQDYAFELSYIYTPGFLEPRKYYTYASARAATVNRVLGVGFTIQLQGA